MKKLLSLRSNTKQIALGFALGVFIGIFPTFGFGIIILAFLTLFIKFNFPAGVIGGAISTNPLTTPFWIFLSYKTGTFLMHLFGVREILLFTNPTLKKLFHFGLDYLVGNILISLVMAFLSYPILIRIVDAYKKRKRRKRRKKKDHANWK